MNHLPWRSRRAGLMALAGILAIVAGCGSTTATPTRNEASASGSSSTSSVSGEPSPSAGNQSASPASAGSSSSNSALYAQIEAEVQRFRELQATKKLDPTILDEAGVRSYMEKAFDEQVDPKVLAANERLYKAMGMLPASASLRTLELDLQSSQVIGFYDPQTKQLYIVSQNGGVGPTQKATFAHEFTHALQDQNFGIASLDTDAPDQGDRDLARTALLEGDATLSMTQWAQARLTMAEIFQMTADAASSDQQQQLDAAPAILRESLTFPYYSGLSFIQRAYNHGGWAAVDAIYKKPPASTSQIIHPELYDQDVQPIAVAARPVPGALAGQWKLSFQDTLGELQLAVWLANEGDAKATAAAKAAVAEWGGDRVALYDGPSGAWAVSLRTVWRSAAGEAAFYAALANAPHAAGSKLRVCRDEGNGADVFVASDAASLDVFATCTPQG